MATVSIYNRYARYYDLVYYWKDYRGEVKKLKQIIAKYKQSAGKDLLDVACGTGEHIRYFNPEFNCFGVDLSPEFIKLARKKVKTAKFQVADMRSFRINRKFDAITCLFSAIAHLHTLQQLEKTIRNFSLHLRPGGVVLIEPWLNPRAFIPGLVDFTLYKNRATKVVRLSYSRKKGISSLLDMHYLLGEEKKGIEYFREKITLQMFAESQFLKIFKQCGLVARYLRLELTRPIRGRAYRGVFVAVKPLSESI